MFSCISTKMGVITVLNRTIIMGRLTRDPELRRTQSGTAVASFALAVERDFKDKDTGEKAADFIDIVAWRGTAEFVSRYFTKGRLVVVEGRLQSRSYEDKSGSKRKAVEVVADNVYFADSRKDGDSTSGAPSAAYGTPGEFKELSDDDGELPF